MIEILKEEVYSYTFYQLKLKKKNYFEIEDISVKILGSDFLLFSNKYFKQF